ncbi:MAG: hypothetical protein WC227_03195 [Patescibacteria group bacterium]|jgi:hypothetical protein
MKMLNYLTDPVNNIAEFGDNLSEKPEDAEIAGVLPEELRTIAIRLANMAEVVKEAQSRIEDIEDRSTILEAVEEINTLAIMHNAINDAFWSDVRASNSNLTDDLGISKGWKVWQRKAAKLPECDTINCADCLASIICPIRGRSDGSKIIHVGIRVIR